VSAFGTIGTSFFIGSLSYVAASDTEFWTHDTPQALVKRVDIATQAAVATIPVGQGDGQVGIGPDAVWVVAGDDGTVMRIDPKLNDVTATIRLAPHINALALSPGAVWVANTDKNTVTRIDAQTNRVVATIATPAFPYQLAFGDGSLWVCNRNGDKKGLTRLDPQTNQVLAQVDLGSIQGAQSQCAGVSVQAPSGAVWVAAYDAKTNRADTLEQIDPQTNQVTSTMQAPANVFPQFVVDGHGVWVCDVDQGVFRLDPRSGQVVGELDGLGCAGMVVSAGSLWLISGAGGTVRRITPTP
jgi:YVTN family beta-propeller protein